MKVFPAMKKMIVCLMMPLLAGPVLSADAVQTLPDFKAPLKMSASGREYAGTLQLDPKQTVFACGSKKIVFNRDSTLIVYSGTREIARAFLFFSTPYRSWQPVTGIKTVSGTYNGKGMQVKAVRRTQDSLTFEGVVPWNRNGDPLIAGNWKISAKIEDGRKLRIEGSFDRPVPDAKGGSGIFFRFQNVKECIAEKLGSWVPGKRASLRGAKWTAIRIEGESPDDSFTIHTPRWRAWGIGAQHLRLDPAGNKVELVIDPGKCREEQTVKSAAEVMKITDDLTVPARGRNLLPNPYFAVPGRFLTSAYTDEQETDGLYSTDAKFGRYSWKQSGWMRFAANVPLEPGDYVYSFYAKGKSRITFFMQSVGVGFTKSIAVNVDSPNQWTRYEVPFNFPLESALAVEFRISSPGMLIDGLQLEKGKKATPFEAPAVEAGETERFFFPSGKDITLGFELSTLEKEVSGHGELRIRNFFGETVAKQKFDYRVAAGKYPKITFKLGKLPDGIYVVKLDYGGRAPEQFYRMAVMPFLKNTHQTARIFSMLYDSHREVRTRIRESYLARLQAIGIGTAGHSRAMTHEVMKKYQRYGIQPFDMGVDARGNSERLKKLFPELKNVPGGHMWFYIRNKSLMRWMNGKFGLLPDYRLMGGWSAEYRKKFIETVAGEIARYPKYTAYFFASEGPHEVKDDQHYPDLFAAFKEAVKSVYPDAWVYEGGEPNMNIYSGAAYTGQLLKRLTGKAKSDLVNAHTYTKDVREIYPSFRGLVAMMKQNPEYADSKITLAEGMHFYPYHVARWNTEYICWNGEGWRGNAPSYDLGWHEKLSAAYYARAWLIFMTEYHRLWCATSSAQNTRNFSVDANLSPRAFQKIPNTLGVLLGNPKRYIGDFTFAPDTKCLVWEDEHGCPLAAVWNEDPAVDSGYKDAPLAKLNYPGAEYIDLMGVKRKPAKDGEFAVSPFPLFIRGRKGDFDPFTKALSAAVLDDPDRLPCHIGFEIVPGNRIKLILVNQVSRDLSGTLTIFGRDHAFKIPRTGEISLLVDLPKKIRPGQFEAVRIPYVCEVQGRKISRTLDLVCFTVPKFTGDWGKVPAIKLTNKVGGKSFTEKNFSGICQLAWEEKKLRLRVTVKDDVFSPGSKPGYRWNDDILQVFFDTRCSAVKTGGTSYDDDDYEYGFMPTADGKRCEVWRGFSPDIQLTLGVAAPKNNTLAPEIPAKFTRTEDGYIYEAEFPADYLLPMKLTKGYNFAFGLYLADRDRGKKIENALSNSIKPGSGCYKKPHLWPIGILTE